jgi:hypothetical protein
MGRYSTLNEDIQRLNSLAGINTTTAPCGCQQPEDGKEIIKSATMGESTDQDKYEDVVFLQGQEADEPLQILHNDGQDAAMEFLKSWHMFGSHMGSSNLGHGSSDQTYEKDGYTMSWNDRIGYIGLQYDLNYNESSNKNIGLKEIQQEPPRSKWQDFYKSNKLK